MHGDTVALLVHWTGLGISTVLLVPLAVVLFFGSGPGWLRKRVSARGIRARGVAAVLFYGLFLLNAVPRLANASGDAVLIATIAGGVSGVAGCILIGIFGLADRRGSRVVDATARDSSGSIHNS